jgi:sugar-specific transcriptional regulator TrmB
MHLDFQKALLKVGFTPIEATVFTTLCTHGPLTGYEVAKLCSISRSNVYAALYSLQEKGKCYLIEGEATKYVPLSKDELLLHIKKEFQEVLTCIHTDFPKSVELSDPYITVKGLDNVLQKIRFALLHCTSHLYLLCSSDSLVFFEEELKKLSEEKKVVIICERNLLLGNALVYKRSKSPIGFHMIIDTQVVLTGELDGASSQCLYTKNASLVRVLRESFATELDFIKMATEETKKS